MTAEGRLLKDEALEKDSNILPQEVETRSHQPIVQGKKGLNGIHTALTAVNDNCGWMCVGQVTSSAAAIGQEASCQDKTKLT